MSKLAKVLIVAAISETRFTFSTQNEAIKFGKEVRRAVAKLAKEHQVMEITSDHYGFKTVDIRIEGEVPARNEGDESFIFELDEITGPYRFKKAVTTAPDEPRLELPVESSTDSNERPDLTSVDIDGCNLQTAPEQTPDGLEQALKEPVADPKAKPTPKGTGKGGKKPK